MRPGIRISTLALLALPAICIACGNASQQTPDVSAQPPSIAGTYEVTGSTTVIATGDSRPIRGTLILSQQGDRYNATLHLNTAFGTTDGNLQADIIGKGEGTIRGDVLIGTAETQILSAAFPGVDPRFPFLARVYGPRILSDSVGQLNEDGSIELEIETRAAEGQRYVATRTTMRGERVRDRGLQGFPPVGAERQAMLEFGKPPTP